MRRANANWVLRERIDAILADLRIAYPDTPHPLLTALRGGVDISGAECAFARRVFVTAVLAGGIDGHNHAATGPLFIDDIGAALAGARHRAAGIGAKAQGAGVGIPSAAMRRRTAASSRFRSETGMAAAIR